MLLGRYCVSRNIKILILKYILEDNDLVGRGIFAGCGDNFLPVDWEDRVEALHETGTLLEHLEDLIKDGADVDICKMLVSEIGMLYRSI